MLDREQYVPGPANIARIQKDRGPNGEEKWTLVLVRELRHSPEKVWEAITDPAHLREWAPFVADGSLGTVGATVKLTTVAAPKPTVSEATVTRADAPNLLEYNWGDFDMRWQLEASGGGTRLTLWTNIGHRFIAMGAAGWQHLFRCSGSPAQRNSHRPHRRPRRAEVRLAAAARGVRQAVRYRNAQLAASGG